MTTDDQGPLADVRVLDASRVLAGPLCGQMLADLGADVVKVERPGQGDETRGWGPPFVGALSSYFLSCNRNKRAMTLELSRLEGQRLFHELARQCDVLLENFRAESAAHMRMSPEQLLATNPRLIICSISGFGRSGPMKDLPGYDFAIQALSGLMNVTGPVDGEPVKVGVAITDVVTALHAGVAILACLHARKSSGHGYHIDLALLDCAVAAQVNLAQAFLTSGVVPPRQGNAHLQIVPYQLFATADSWLVVAVGNDHQWQHFCQAAQRDDLAQDSRFHTNRMRVQERSILVPIIEEVMRTRTTEQWQDRLHEFGVPNAPVWNYAELFAQPQAAARGLRVTVKDPDGNSVDLLGSPFKIAGAELPEAKCPPTLGQHTDAILSEWLSLSKGEVQRLRREGVV